MAITRRACILMSAVAAPLLWGADEDDILYDKIHRRLNNDRDLKIQRLKVQVRDGIVTVDGIIRTEKKQQKISKVAKIKGVKKVINRVKVVP